MSDADVTNTCRTRSSVEHRFQIRKKHRSSRNNRVDIAKQRLGFVQGDDLAHLIPSELS